MTVCVCVCVVCLCVSACVRVCVCLCVCVHRGLISENFLLRGNGSPPEVQPPASWHFLQTMAGAMATVAFRFFRYVSSYGGQDGQTWKNT